jgi:argininosuccinate lyase
MISTATFNVSRMAEAAGRGFTAATDIADDLARRGVPFREAHEIVGGIVAHCEKNGLALEDLTTEDLREFWEGFPDGYRVNSPMESAASRTSYGGCAPERVREQLAEAGQLLGGA